MRNAVATAGRYRRLGSMRGMSSPAALFALGEPGLWIDPDDVVTLFQNTAGTTPVTTPGQSVALALDKSRGLVPGPELVVNGDFSNGLTGWTLIGVGNTSTVASGVAQITGTTSPGLRRAGILTVGRTYRISLRIRRTAGSADYFTVPGIVPNPTISGSFQTLTYYGVAATTDFEVGISSTATGTTLEVDDISVRELPGNHATQASSGSRPVYALLPANGVRNLANGSADATNFSIWTVGGTANGISVTRSGAGIDVDGLPFDDYTVAGTATAADRRFLIAGGFRTSASVGQQFAISATVQRTVGSAPPAGCGVSLDVLGETAPAGTYVEGAVNLSLPVDAASPTTFTRTYTLANAASNQANGVVTIETANGAAVNYTVRIKALQMERGSTRTAYQFNYSNVNIAQPPFAQVGALLFDGVDDFLQTPSVDFAGYEQLGSELVTNGSFAADANWDKGTGWSIGSGVATKVAGTASNLGQSVAPITAGRAYRVTFNVTVTAGSVDFLFTGGSTTFAATNLTTTQTVSVTATALGSNNYFVFVANAAFAGTVDNISVREVLRPADKMTVFAGVRKLRDTAQASVVSVGNLPDTVSGSLSLRAPALALNNYALRSRGTATAPATSGAFPAPDTAVLTGLADISGDAAILRRNGVQISSSNADQGTGNFGNHPIYIGQDGTGTALPFSGYLYSLIVRGATTSTDQTVAIESGINGKMSAY